MEKWLCDAEEKYNIEILFACEAGSRAWGTDDAESDYDVRFIFKHRDLRAYLSLERDIEVIDTAAAPFDAHGWDVFKAFGLMKKSNPSIYEWAYSPIIYRDVDKFSVRLRKIAEKEFSHYKLFQHYIQLFSRNLKEAAQKETFTEKKQKLLIQAVRAYLIARQILDTDRLNGSFLYKELFRSQDNNIFIDFYRELAKEKQNGRLVCEKYADRMVYLLKSEKEAMYAAAETMSAKSKPVSGLNEWLWELLKI